MVNKLSNKLFALISIGLTFMISSTAVSTLCAFVGKERHAQEISIDLGYKKYFDPSSGDGTSIDTPYLISNPQHLRNLAELTNLGLFNSSHYFKLKNNIDFTSETPKLPIQPIGTMHTPFSSNFDGGDFIIKGINTVGSDVADIGVFGTVGIDGSIKNFILDSPIVTSKSNFTGSWTSDNYLSNIDNNPLRKQINATANLTPGGIIQSGSGNNAIDEGFTNFTIAISGLENTPYTASVVVSDPNYLVQDKANPLKFTVNTNQTVSKYLSVRVYINAVVTLPDNTNRFASYNVELFKLYYEASEQGKSDKNYIVMNPNNAKEYKKMINPDIEYNPSSNSTSTYHYNNQVHFAGVVAGNLYGVADRIAVHKPKLEVQGKPFVSNSILIGRKIDDDNKSPLTKTNVAFDSFNDTNNRLVIEDIPKGNGFTSEDRGHGNRMITNIYGNENNVGLINNATKNNIRFYAANANGPRDDVAQGSVKPKPGDDLGINLSPLMSVEEYETGEISNRRALNFTKDVNGYIHWSMNLFFNASYDYARFDNCLFMFASAEDNNSILGKLLSGNTGTFYLTFEFDYLLFDDSYDSLAPDTNTLKSLEILAGRKYLKKSGNDWYVKTASTQSTETNDGLYLLDKLTLDGVASTTDNKKFQYADLVKDPETNQDPLLFKNKNVAGKVSDASLPNKTFKAQHKAVRVKAIIDNYLDPTAWRGTAMPYFLFGMDSTNDVDKNYIFSLLNLEIIISDINGTYGGANIKVDFAKDVGSNGTPSMPENNKKEWQSSKRRVSVSLLNEKGVVNNDSSGNPIAPAKLTPAAGAEQFDSYSITASYSGNTVTISYKIVDSKGTKLNIAPINTNGFTAATITQQ